jgi:hypothetical protein
MVRVITSYWAAASWPATWWLSLTGPGQRHQSTIWTFFVFVFSNESAVIFNVVVHIFVCPCGGGEQRQMFLEMPTVYEVTFILQAVGC